MEEEKRLKPWKVIPKTFSGCSSATLNSSPDYQKQVHSQDHRKNAITTSKYTWITFLPKNIFEQFHRFANVYFLSIIILNWVPAINAFGKEIAMIPLLFVLSVTAVKDLFEDRRRHKSDRDVNNRNCRVYSRSCRAYVNEKWKNIVVGDIIKISSDDPVPADILLLNASDEGGICYVSTASLDGETNLKQKQPVNFLEDGKSQSDFLPTDVKFIVECEQPNNHIHSFNGKIELVTGERVPVDQRNLLLRGSVIRNTESVEGLVVYSGHDTKAMLNNSGPRYKRSKLERDINKDVLACVFILFILCTAGGIGCGLWTRFNEEVNKDLGLTTREPAMEGFVRFWTFIIILQVIIPVSLYVSIELVKLGQVYFINQDIELYYEPASNFTICRATTINEDLGQIKYVFSDKTGTLTENKMILKRFSVLGAECSIPEGLCQEALSDHCREIELRTLSDRKLDFQNSWTEFFTGISICNSVVVIDTTKSMDSVGSRDNGAFDDSTLRTTPSKCKESDAITNPNRGSVKMNGSKDFCAGSNFHDPSSPSEPYVMYKNQHFYDKKSEVARRLSKNGNMHKSGSLTSNSRQYNSTARTPKLAKIGDYPKYEAESPDEEALVKAAQHFGYRLKARLPDCVRLQFPNDDVTDFELLHTLEFDSTRKRMSVIVRNPDGRIQVFCKGADTSILNRLSNFSDPSVERIEMQIQEYAHEGLRTLCVAKRDLSDEEYSDWANRYKEAELSVENREEMKNELINSIESDLVLLGATAVEDKLQDGVSDTIASLREAGIKIWVLTGDKRETAVNIAFSSKLLDEEMEIIEMNAKSMDECNDQLDTGLQRLASLLPTYTFSPMHSNKSTSLALVIDGATLAIALKNTLCQKFIDLAECCSAVLCCRAAPIQKASVVRLVRDNLKAMCLAIGDGANDVSMLQMADVGVGIVGNEGMQAVMASDFVVGRFKFLKRLLLLHGHWCYDRLSRMIVYFFYKNAFFVFLLFWYQLFNGFSGSNAIDDMSLILFTLIFTSTPSIVIGILDQCTSPAQLLSKPHLYKRGQDSKAYTRKLFWANMLDALYQSIVLFALPYFTYKDTDVGQTAVGVLFHQVAVITSSFHLAIEVPSWTFMHHVFLWGSIILSYIWFFGLCAVLFAYRTYWVIYNFAATSDFWLLTILTPVAALLPRYLARCVQATFFPTEASLSRLEALVSSKNSQHSLRRFGSETFHHEPPTSTTYEDIA